jgi:predicted nucleotidyltransferase
MRLNNPLDHILDSRTKIVCLRFLCNYPTYITGRQLAQIIKINRTTVSEALNALVYEQIILVRGAGTANIYELNKSNWIVTKLLIPLFKEEGGLLELFLKCISHGVRESPLRVQIISVSLFGSVHERREKPVSDIDLFVVVKEAKNQKSVEDLFFKMSTDLRSSINMGIEPYVKTIAEFKKDRELNVIKAILKSHQIIYGEKLEKIL